MPDVDKIGKLSRRWSKVFKEVCEGYFDSVLLANDAINPLRKDIENYGKSPVRFLKEASNRLKSIRNNPLFLPLHNWSDEDRFIHDLKFAYMQKDRPNQRGITIAISAYKNLVHKFRNGENINGNLEEVLLRGYIRQIYDSNFSDLVPLTLQNHLDIDHEGISRRLDEMSIFVDMQIDIFAYQISRKGTVKGLRINAGSAAPKTISIEDDVFNLGSNR